MPAYVLALIQDIHDAETYKSYVGQVEPTLAPFGGRFLARVPGPHALEGGPAPTRAIVLEFPSEEHARQWHASPPYQPVMKLRQGASRGTLLLLPAYPPSVAPRVGDVVYVEHVTPEPGGLRAALEAAHGWRFEGPEASLGGAFVATLPGGARCAIRAPMDAQEKPVTRSYVRVKDLDAGVAALRKAGAEVMLGAMSIPSLGRIAIARAGGAEVGLWELP